jgi:general L-amino acid transport system permease protein
VPKGADKKSWGQTWLIKKGVSTGADDSGRVSMMNDPKVRGFVFQGIVDHCGHGVMVWSRALAMPLTTLPGREFPPVSDFSVNAPGFDIGQALIPYTNDSTYLRAFFVGSAQHDGGRHHRDFLSPPSSVLWLVWRSLSKNYLVQKFATIYVEVAAQHPTAFAAVVLVQGGVVDPAVATRRRDLSRWRRRSLFNINNRGLYMPRDLVPEGRIRN